MSTNPYYAGYDSYEAGVHLSENPHLYGSYDYLEWRAGWLYAEFDEEAL